jgi:hypothetical protein
MSDLAFPKPEKRGRAPRARIRTRRPPGTKRREAKAAGGVDPDTWEAILTWYGYRCAIDDCGPWQEQGHAVALAHDGIHAASNVYPVSSRCNARIGTRTVYPPRRHPYMPKEA